MTYGYRVPNLFIVGAPKCGTTALSSYLARHPRIFMSDSRGVKEPHYFATDIWDGRHHVRDWDAYLALFSDVPMDVPYVGEASVNYLYSKVAATNILEVSPEARFIVMVRNPIEIATGLHNEHIKRFSEPVVNFEKAWRLQHRRLEDPEKWSAYVDPRILQYGDRAKVGEQLERFLDIVPISQVRVIIYEDFAADTQLVFENLLSFLGLQEIKLPEIGIVNPSVSYKYPILQAWMARIRRFRIKHGLPGGVGIQRLVDRINRRYGRSVISRKMKEELHEFFREDVERLSKLLDRDFSHWLV